jgi:hypothetical protein
MNEEIAGLSRRISEISEELSQASDDKSTYSSHSRAVLFDMAQDLEYLAGVLRQEVGSDSKACEYHASTCP